MAAAILVSADMAPRCATLGRSGSAPELLTADARRGQTQTKQEAVEFSTDVEHVVRRRTILSTHGSSPELPNPNGVSMFTFIRPCDRSAVAVSRTSAMRPGITK